MIILILIVYPISYLKSLAYEVAMIKIDMKRKLKNNNLINQNNVKKMNFLQLT